jgi:uncharacterized protein YgbK (DUF1537 family)
MHLRAQKVLDELVPVWPDDLLPAIREQVGKRNESVVVLDDDPTGTQTVHDVPILTGWDVDVLSAEFGRATPLFYILTNSRSLPRTHAEELAGEIGQNLQRAAQQTGRRFVVISRSDSTLRGHYPAEVDALAQALGKENAVCVIIPFFKEGGRLTINDVHHVLEDDVLVPAAETPFARDPVFGYKHSDLKDWVQEKTQGRIPRPSVVSLSLHDIRKGGPEKVTEVLSQCSPGNVCIVNATEYRDVEVVTAGLLTAEQQGKEFICRTAASFVPVRAGMSLRPLLSPQELQAGGEGGALIIVGSYVPKSSTQLRHLIDNTSAEHVELSVQRVLSQEGSRRAGSQSRAKEITTAIEHIESALSRSENIVVYTSRELVPKGVAPKGRAPEGQATAGGDEANLSKGQQISRSLVQIVQGVKTRPRYILAKGGITSSDIATGALEIRRGRVLGQILPGVPVWRTDEHSRFPALPYIVFPGNVGGPDALTKIVNMLSNEA